MNLLEIVAWNATSNMTEHKIYAEKDNSLFSTRLIHLSNIIVGFVSHQYSSEPHESLIASITG